MNSKSSSCALALGSNMVYLINATNPKWNLSELAFAWLDLPVFSLPWLCPRQFLARIQRDRGKSVLVSYHRHLPRPPRSSLGKQAPGTEGKRREEYNDLVVASSQAGRGRAHIISSTQTPSSVKRNSWTLWWQFVSNIRLWRKVQDVLHNVISYTSKI